MKYKDLDEMSILFLCIFENHFDSRFLYFFSCILRTVIFPNSNLLKAFYSPCHF